MWVVRSWKNKRERTRHDERTAVKKILSSKVLDVPKEQRAREFGWERPEPGDVTRRLSQLYRMKANKTLWDTIQKISYIYRAREKQQIGKLRHQTS